MSRRKKLVLAAVGVLFLLFLASLKACPPWVYFGAEIRGTVLDAETKQPLEGVVVVATWCMDTVGWGHTGPPVKLYSAEAVTDQRGSFTIPAWGPKARPPWAYVEGYDPHLYFYKSGYTPERRGNYHVAGPMVSHSDWNGSTIKLQARGNPSRDDLQRIETTLIGCGVWSASSTFLLDEMLKEKGALGRYDKPYFEMLERVRRDR